MQDAQDPSSAEEDEGPLEHIAEDDGPAAGTRTQDAESGRRPSTPTARFLARHGTVAGIVLTVLTAAFGILFAVVVPSDVTGSGFRPVVLRWAGPVSWLLIAGAALTWTLRTQRRVTNAFAYAALGCYVVYLVVRAF